MGDSLVYLQVELSCDKDEYSGMIHWPKSTEDLSEFVSEEWFSNPLRCMNHFGARGWEYVETRQIAHGVSLLFVKRGA